MRAGRGVLVSRDGEVEPATPAALTKHLASNGLILTHAPFVWRRLGARPPQRTSKLYDLAELFAFAHPARFATPTTLGIAHELGLEAGPTLEDEAALTHVIADRLLADIAALKGDVVALILHIDEFEQQLFALDDFAFGESDHHALVIAGRSEAVNAGN